MANLSGAKRRTLYRHRVVYRHSAVSESRKMGFAKRDLDTREEGERAGSQRKEPRKGLCREFK